MAVARKLSDGLLPCGRCGVEPEIRQNAAFRLYIAECPACDLHTHIRDTVADTIVEWNNLSATTHPDPEDYYELLRECSDVTPLLKRLYDTGDDSEQLLRELEDEYGDDE